MNDLLTAEDIDALNDLRRPIDDEQLPASLMPVSADLSPRERAQETIRVEQQRMKIAPSNGDGAEQDESEDTPIADNRSDDDFPLTDTGNAERLMSEHGDKLRFVGRINKPIVFNQTHWIFDETGAANRLALNTIRRQKLRAVRLSNSEEPADKLKAIQIFKHAHKCESARSLKDMLGQAAKVYGATIMPEALDADPWLLNCLNGTLDLRTGQLRKHRREDFITRLCPVDYDLSATCPTFLSFLDRIFASNDRLIAFVRRVIGYTLTGVTSERSLFILHGSGANGKSTLLGVLSRLLVDYSAQIPAASLMVKHNDNSIPNDIAALRAARYVNAMECDEGKRIAEAMVKQMTGGEDMLQGRFLYGELFTFRPQFKLFIATNHRPEIRGTDPAIWDRIKLIPFDVRIPEDERDRDLPAKLAAELPGILAWAVRGCLEWQRDGLGVPAEVKEATAVYRDDMDRMGDFIAECCVVGDRCEAPATPLYEVYAIWCKLAAEKPMNQTRFGRKLDEMGFKSDRDSTGRKVRLGVGIRSSEQSEQFG